MSIEIASAEEQYEKFPSLDRADVLKLKEWYDKQPHLPKITEFEIITFLHAAKYSVEKAKLMMETYFTIRTHFTELFSKRDVLSADITNQMDLSAYMLLDGASKRGHRVVLWKLTDTDVFNYNFVDNSKLFSMWIDLCLARDGITKGYALIMDMDGTTLSHLAKVNLVFLKKFLYYIQEASPVRLKAFHFINTVSFMDKVLAVMRPFLKKELMDNMHLHSSLDTFIDVHVPRSSMPDEYGGSGGKVKDIQAKAYKELKENAQFNE